jgi:parvulin-like peptidyl-prolyl isomerase
MKNANEAPGRVRRIVWAALHEPLLHFAVAGMLLFALIASKQGGEERPEIRISAADVAQITAYWEAQTQRKPSPEELRGLVQERIDEEVLAQEALRLGLDQDDVIIRRRLAQKMAFISEDLATVVEPDEAALRAYFEAHRAAYATPELYGVRHLFFSVDSRGINLERDARSALRRLLRGANPATMGDPFMLPGEFADASRTDIARDLGGEFAQAVADGPIGKWQGPVRSPFGFHLIRVESRSPATDARFEEVRDRVREALLAQRRQEANAAFRADLRGKYRVVVEGASEAGAS